MITTKHPAFHACSLRWYECIDYCDVYFHSLHTNKAIFLRSTPITIRMLQFSGLNLLIIQRYILFLPLSVYSMCGSFQKEFNEQLLDWAWCSFSSALSVYALIQMLQLLSIVHIFARMFRSSQLPFVFHSLKIRVLVSIQLLVQLKKKQEKLCWTRWKLCKKFTI